MLKKQGIPTGRRSLVGRMAATVGAYVFQGIGRGAFLEELLPLEAVNSALPTG